MNSELGAVQLVLGLTCRILLGCCGGTVHNCGFPCQQASRFCMLRFCKRIPGPSLHFVAYSLKHAIGGLQSILTLLNTAFLALFLPSAGSDVFAQANITFSLLEFYINETNFMYFICAALIG